MFVDLQGGFVYFNRLWPVKGEVDFRGWEKGVEIGNKRSRMVGDLCGDVSVPCAGYCAYGHHTGDDQGLPFKFHAFLFG